MRNESGRQYWVIGGEYADTSFRQLCNDDAETFGPFDTYEAALSTWRTRSSETRAMGHVRYTIAVNTAGA